MSGGARGRQGDVGDGFDPLAEGASYRLRPEVASAIWERARGEATDRKGRRDEARARQLFRELAGRAAERGGAAPLTEGKRSLVETEAWRQAPAKEGAQHETAADGWLASMIASVRSPAGERAPSGTKTGSTADAMDRAVADGSRVPYLARMEQAFGEDFGSVRATVGASSALGELGAVGAARGEEIAFASSTPDPAVVAHELAHVVQRRRNTSGASTPVEDESSSAEHEAERVGALVAAGEQAPPITQVPTGLVARAIPRQGPRAPAQVGAGEWLDRMLLMSPLRPQVAAQLVGAQLPSVHPRLVWNAAGALLQRVWSSVGNAARLQLVLAPFDLLARIDQVRELSEQKGKLNVGPLSYVPEVATVIAREVETAVSRCVQRLGPRLVVAYDASVDPWAGKPAVRDAASLPPNSIVASHPIDRMVEDALREGGIATLRPRVATEDEPAADRVVPGALRAITYRWADDPALWNWIRTEPADATPEEVAKHVLGSTARAYEIQGSAPFFGLPASDVKRMAPERSNLAALRVGEAMNGPGFAGAAEELQQGVSETALARSKVGEQAALAQAAQTGENATAAHGNADAAGFAARCQAQVHLITDSYPQLGAGPKLAPMAARLASRTKRLQAMPAADLARFGRLFAEQSSVLYAVAGDLETLANQAKKLAHGTTAPIDPTIAEIAALVLEAGASADLPAIARKQLALAHARHASIPFDVMEGMIDDARARTMATDSLAETSGPGDSGATKTAAPMTGREQWQDLRSRETKLSGDVLAARRAHDAGTEKAGATRMLAERTRALQVEARVVAAETQCAYMGDKLAEQEGVVATVAGQMSDLQNARNGLRALANTMAGIRVRWREKHAQLFAVVASGASGKAEGDPAAIRHAIAELEAELAQVGDDKTRAALQTAQSELKDMAVARAVADIAVMIGLTLVTGALGSAASGAARGLGMGRTAAQLVNVATQSVAMATLRTMLYHDTFASAFGSELLSNFAGLAALRGVAAGLSKLKLGKALAVLKEGGGAWKYVAHGTELTIEAVTQGGIQFAVAQAESLVRQGRTLDDDELRMLAIQGIGMFIGNAITHRLTSPAMDGIAAYAARVGAPYRRAQVLSLAKRVASGDADASKDLIREERALIAEELAVLQQIGRDPHARAQFGEKILATVTEQAHQHIGELTHLGVEHALQNGLAEISPGKAWEGSTNQVEPALAEARAAGASVHHEQLGDSSRRHIVAAGANHYTVYERAPGPAPASIRGATEAARAKLSELEGRPGSKVNAPANAADARLLQAAHAAAGHGSSASQVLDEIHRLLPVQQQKELEAFRKKVADGQVLKAIEGAVARQDLAQFLGEKLLSQESRDHLRDAIFDARAELARARLVELGVAGDGLVQSRLRQVAADLVRKLDSTGGLNESRVAEEVAHADVTEIVGDLGEAIARSQLYSEAVRTSGRRVLSNVEVVTRVKEFSTIKEWQSAQRAKGGPIEPSGLYEADGKLWKSITEVDNIVVEVEATGALRPVILEQVKAGAANSPTEASDQNTKAMLGLQAIKAGSKDVAIYDRVGKNELGAQRTGELDLSRLGDIEARGLKTRGLPGKGFDAALDLGDTAMGAKDARKVLEEIARDLLRGRVLELVRLKPEGSK